MKLHRTLSMGLAVMLTSAVMLTGCGGGTQPKKEEPAAQAPAAKAKPFEGVTIRFLAAQHPWTDTIKKSRCPRFCSSS